MLALRALPDELRAAHAAENADTVDGSGSLARDHALDGEGQSWRRVGLIDDLDGTPIPGGKGETIDFAVDGVTHHRPRPQ